MDIETVSVDIDNAEVKEQAPAQTKAKSIDGEKEQAATVDTLNSCVETITDPNLGQNINLLE